MTELTLNDKSARPGPDDYAEYFNRYVGLVETGDIVEILAVSLERLVATLRGLPPGAEAHRYAAGKWTVREMLGHIIDTERIMAYRGLRIARGDLTPLAPFDQDLFVAGADFERRSMPDLIEEFVFVRQGTLALFRHLQPAAWDRRGLVGENRLTPRAAAWIIAGHQVYHEAILSDRYGIVTLLTSR